MKTILGISAFYHDSAATLIYDGEVIAAAQEERFSRKKHDAEFPEKAIKYCLSTMGIQLADVDHIVFFEKPFLKFERLLETYVAFAPKGINSFKAAMPIWLRERLFQKNLLLKKFKKIDNRFIQPEKLSFSEHHFSHAASAYYPSPFNEAIILTLDGVGEWATTTVAIGQGNKLNIKKEIHFPHSLGLLYSAFTYYAGFKVNSGEYKLMGLAPYGIPKYKDLILKNIIDIKEDGTFHLNQSYFNYCTGLTMTNRKFDKLFSQPARVSEDQPLTQFHMDIAASVQAVIEESILKITRSLYQEYKIPNLCLAGGVALNCVANGKILRDNSFKNLWIQPAAGDAGGSLGAALGYWYKELKKPRPNPKGDGMKGSYLGPIYNTSEIKKTLENLGAKFTTLTNEQLINATAQALEKEEIIGWFNGRMEFGPRALGNRSILGDPRSKKMQKNLNLKIKFRESFRPFAPSILSEYVSDWFEISSDSPYMLLVANVHPSKRHPISSDAKELFGIDKLNMVRSKIPAVTHVDYSARVQTVHKKTNPLYHALLSKFHELTKCPILINTSFNVRGEPIVCSPEDAFNCFMGTNLDVLVCGNCILYKKNQEPSLIKDYKDKYDLD